MSFVDMTWRFLNGGAVGGAGGRSVHTGCKKGRDGGVGGGGERRQV